jgi:hypothetical protein
MSSINHATKLAFGLATALLLMAPVAATPAAAQINFGFSIGGREPPPPRREERRHLHLVKDSFGAKAITGTATVPMCGSTVIGSNHPIPRLPGFRAIGWRGMVVTYG